MVFQESKRFVPKIGRHGLSSFGVRQPWQRDREAMDMPRGILVTSDGGGKNQPFDDEGQLSVLKAIQFTYENQIHLGTKGRTKKTLEALKRALERK